MQRILYIPFDHLHRDYGVLRESDPTNDVILFVESERMLKASQWHRQRVWFLLSAARHFARDLEAAGYRVMYLRAATTFDGITIAREANPNAEVWCAEPSSHRATTALRGAGVHFVPNDFFLTSRTEFTEWARGQKQLLMETFYRSQRRRLRVLMDGDEPLGGRWNFDADNRLPPAKNHTYPPYLEHARDDIDSEVLRDIDGLDLWGAAPGSAWSHGMAATS